VDNKQRLTCFNTVKKSRATSGVTSPEYMKLNTSLISPALSKGYKKSYKQGRPNISRIRVFSYRKRVVSSLQCRPHFFRVFDSIVAYNKYRYLEDESDRKARRKLEPV